MTPETASDTNRTDADLAELAELVEGILAPWRSLDIAAILESFEPDGVLQSMMAPPIRGTDRIGKVLAKHLAHVESIEFEVVNIARNGEVIFVERVDHLLTKAGTIALPVVGVIHLREGKIREWREYFDQKQSAEPPK